MVHRRRDRRLDRAWLHVDLDVLDQSVMPAMDSRDPEILYAAPRVEMLGQAFSNGR